MASDFTLRVRDYSGEYSSARFRGVTIDAANFAAQAALRATLEASVAAIIIGNIAERTVVAIKSNVNDTPPASPYAQRELKWLVSYSDDVTGLQYQLEIPTSDASNLVLGTDLMDVAPASQGADFVAAFEAYQRALGVNAISFNTARLVGRNI